MPPLASIIPESYGIGKTVSPYSNFLVPDESNKANLVVGRILNLELENCMMRFSDLVEITKKKRGGVPVLKETRFTVAQLIAEIADGRHVEEVCDVFGLDKKQVGDVLHCIALCLDQPLADKRYLGSIGDGLARPDADEVGTSQVLEERFRKLVADWKVARGHMASINNWVRLPQYQQIIELGRKQPNEIIPLLLRELDQRPDHWFWALKELTAANPVSPESRGNVIEMAKCWISWGKNQGYHW